MMFFSFFYVKIKMTMKHHHQKKKQTNKHWNSKIIIDDHHANCQTPACSEKQTFELNPFLCLCLQRNNKRTVSVPSGNLPNQNQRCVQLNGSNEYRNEKKKMLFTWYQQRIIDMPCDLWKNWKKKYIILVHGFSTIKSSISFWNMILIAHQSMK